MSKKAVAYIDLLGFSDCVKYNQDKAIKMLSNFNTILSILNFERKIHPSSGYAAALQNLAKRTSNESFEHFIPFSDSVFIASSDCNNFIMQLGNFVKQSFLFNAQFFSHPECYDTSFNHEPSVLFRGGIAFGDVIETTLLSVFNNQTMKCNNLMGEAAVRAVGMEKIVKGPRLIFDKSVYDQLNDEVILYVRQLPEKNNAEYYEILWPAMCYIVENKKTITHELVHFYDIFMPAYNLWKYHKGGKVAVHYERFLELTVASAVKIYSKMGYRDFILKKMAKALKGIFTDEERNRLFEGVFD